MNLLALTQHVQDVLVVHLDQVIQQYLAGFQQKAQHQGITLVFLEPFDVLGIVSACQFVEVIHKGRIHDPGLNGIDAGVIERPVTFQVALNRRYGGRGRVFLQ